MIFWRLKKRDLGQIAGSLIRTRYPYSCFAVHTIGQHPRSLLLWTRVPVPALLSCSKSLTSVARFQEVGAWQHYLSCLWCQGEYWGRQCSCVHQGFKCGRKGLAWAWSESSFPESEFSAFVVYRLFHLGIKAQRNTLSGITKKVIAATLGRTLNFNTLRSGIIWILE